MNGYISPRARISRASVIASSATIFGPSIVSDHTLLDVCVSIGYPFRRKLRRLQQGGSVEEFYARLDELSEGAKIGSNVIIRKNTIIYENVIIEDNVETGHNVIIREHSKIGRNSLIGTGTIIDGYVTIGENTRIESGVYIPPSTEIGRNVFIGPRAVFTNDKYPPSRRLEGAKILDNAIIGGNATILPGITIGRFSVVAAGSIVTRDVPDYTVVAGAPARPIMEYSEYIRKRAEWEKHQLK